MRMAFCFNSSVRCFWNIWVLVSDAVLFSLPVPSDIVSCFCFDVLALVSKSYYNQKEPSGINLAKQNSGEKDIHCCI